MASTEKAFLEIESGERLPCLFNPAQLAINPEIRKVIEAHVEEINQKFARVEQVKKVAILPRDLTQEDGELTPTLKVKRAVVTQKHEKEIEELYAA